MVAMVGDRDFSLDKDFWFHGWWSKFNTHDSHGRRTDSWKLSSGLHMCAVAVLSNK